MQYLESANLLNKPEPRFHWSEYNKAGDFSRRPGGIMLVVRQGHCFFRMRCPLLFGVFVHLFYTNLADSIVPISIYASVEEEKIQNGFRNPTSNNARRTRNSKGVP